MTCANFQRWTIKVDQMIRTSLYMVRSTVFTYGKLTQKYLPNKNKYYIITRLWAVDYFHTWENDYALISHSAQMVMGSSKFPCQTLAAADYLIITNYPNKQHELIRKNFAPKLAIRALLVGRVHEDSSIQQCSVNICYHTAWITTPQETVYQGLTTNYVTTHHLCWWSSTY